MSRARCDLVRAVDFPVAGRPARLAASLVALAGLCLPGGPAAAGTLTEAEVIRLARERDPRALVAGAEVAEAEAEALRAGLYPDPSLAWSREHVPGGADAAREDTIEVTIPIDVAGRRAAGRALARSRVAGARAKEALARREAVAAALLGFYDAIAAGHRAEIAARAVASLDEAARVLGRRHEQGTASGYELSRLELEAELARSELRQAEAGAQAARVELALMLGIDPAELTLGGSLAVAAPGPAAPEPAPSPVGSGAPRRAHASSDTLPETPWSRLLATSVAEARAARDHARRAWIPELSVSGGLRRVDAGETRYGYVAGVALGLPLFSRGRDARAEARARERLVLAHAHAAELAARRALARAETELARALGELGSFDEATRERLERLSRAAESGYREGERSLVELIDAQRARTAVALRRLELELEAKRAEVALRAARGELE